FLLLFFFFSSSRLHTRFSRYWSSDVCSSDLADHRGFLYIATLGGYRGLLQLDPQGSFQSFYGANRTALSVLDSIKRALYTRKMRSEERRVGKEDRAQLFRNQ